MKKLFYYTLTLAACVAAMSGCNGIEVVDEDINAYSLVASVDNVQEGNDIPVHLYFSDAGLQVDNKSWGDKWKNANFYGFVYDSMGREVENTVFSGPSGVLAKGAVFDVDPSGKMDIIIGGLREGSYMLKLNIRTRYAVNTWATASFAVMERGGVIPPPSENIPVEDIIVPGKDNGLEIDEIGNIILDLRYFGAANPFRFVATVRPDNATNKQLLGQSDNAGVADIRIEGQTLLVITPKTVGVCKMSVSSADGAVTRTFGVKVINTPPDADGFTLPTDDSERNNYDFDVAGRLALDINEYNDGNPFEYTCRPIPAGAAKPSLVASSSDENILVATIRDGNQLKLTPKSPGYVTVTVSTTNGSIVRTMKVAVYSRIQLIIKAVEEAQSEEDKVTGIFPCKLTVHASSSWLPKVLQMEVYGKATGRIDLTDPVDYFKVDSLKNTRTAYYSFEEKVPLLYLANGNSNYNVYTRLMKKVAAMGAVVHHSADWPNYKDYIIYFRLYQVKLNFSVKEDFDTNLYRISIVEEYNSPEHRLYHYLF